MMSAIKLTLAVSPLWKQIHGVTLCLLCMIGVNCQGQSVAFEHAAVSRLAHPESSPLAASRLPAALLFAGPTGVYVSKDNCRTFAAKVEPKLFAYVQGVDAVESNRNGVFIVAGVDGAQVVGGTMLRSSDWCESWNALETDSLDQTEFRKISDDALNFFTPSEVRFQNLFSTNAGESWRRVPTTTELTDEAFPTVVRHLSDGVFVASFARVSGWYQADLSSRLWLRRNDLPYRYKSLVQLSNGSRIGWFENGRYDGLATYKPGDTAWKEFTSVLSVGGTTYDSIDVGSLTDIDGNYALVTDVAGRLIVWDGGSFEVITVPGIGLNQSFTYALHDEALAVIRAPKYIVILNCDDMTVKKIPAIGYSHLEMMNGNLIAYSNDERLYRYSEEDSTWIRTGAIRNDNNVDYPTPFIALTLVDGQPLVEDNLRGIFLEKDEQAAGLRVVSDRADALRSVYRQGVYDFFGRFGRSWLWGNDAEVYTGGAKLKHWSLDSKGRVLAVDTVFGDTAIAYHQALNGTLYVGYRDLHRKVKDGLWKPLAVNPMEDTTGGRGAISTIFETMDGTIIVGRRGYEEVTNGSDDTVHVQGGVLRSTDDGETWSQVALPVRDGYVTSMSVRIDGSVWMSSTQVLHMVFRDDDGAVDSDVFYQNDTHMLSSTDDGQTWNLVLSQPSSGPLNHSTRNVDFDGSKISAVFPDRLMVSTNSGVDWQMVDGLPQGEISAARFDKQHNLWIATAAGLWVARTDTTTRVHQPTSRTIDYKIYQESANTMVDISQIPNPDEARAHVVDLLGRSVPIQTEIYGTLLRCKLSTTGGVYLLRVDSPNESHTIPLLVLP